MIYFDNAATTYPKPFSVVSHSAISFFKYGANPGRSGHRMSMQTAKKIYGCREAASELFHCEPEQVVFTKNCTEAVNIVMKGILKQGDHLIISDLEHNAVYRTAEALQEQGIISYDIAETSNKDDETVAAFANLVTPQTKLIVCTQGSNVFGIRLPVEKIGAMAHKKGIKMAVDAAQTAGLLNIFPARDNIDYLCLPGHKGLYGPMGTGMIIFASDELPIPLCQGGTGSLSMQAKMPQFLPDLLESGTLNTPGIVGLKEGIRFVQKKTPQMLFQKEAELCDRLEEGLLQLQNVVVYSKNCNIDRSLPVLSFNIKNLPSVLAAQKLDEKGVCVRAGYHCSALAHQKFGTQKQGTIRVSLGAFNTKREVDSFCRIVQKLTKESGR